MRLTNSAKVEHLIKTANLDYSNSSTDSGIDFADRINKKYPCSTPVDLCFSYADFLVNEDDNKLTKVTFKIAAERLGIPEQLIKLEKAALKKETPQQVKYAFSYTDSKNKVVRKLPISTPDQIIKSASVLASSKLNEENKRQPAIEICKAAAAHNILDQIPDQIKTLGSYVFPRSKCASFHFARSHVEDEELKKLYTDILTLAETSDVVAREKLASLMCELDRKAGITVFNKKTLSPYALIFSSVPEQDKTFKLASVDVPVGVLDKLQEAVNKYFIKEAAGLLETLIKKAHSGDSQPLTEVLAGLPEETQTSLLMYLRFSK